jgi:hypothetical protein
VPVLVQVADGDQIPAVTGSQVEDQVRPPVAHPNECDTERLCVHETNLLSSPLLVSIPTGKRRNCGSEKRAIRRSRKMVRDSRKNGTPTSDATNRSESPERISELLQVPSYLFVIVLLGVTLLLNHSYRVMKPRPMAWIVLLAGIALICTVTITPILGTTVGVLVLAVRPVRADSG